MNEIGKVLRSSALLLMLGSGCGSGGRSTVTDPSHARGVQLFNCTHVNGPTQPPSGRAYNVFTRVDGGAWAARGGLNPQPGDWTDCHDAAHTASSVTISLLDSLGKWEVRAIALPRSEEQQCDSSAPDVANACSYIANTFQSDIAAPTARVDLSDEAG